MDSESSDGWDYRLSKRAEDQFANLDPETQEQIITRLDEVVNSEWREPEDFLESISNSPYQKLRAGGYRLGCRVDHSTRVLKVASIRKREGAYKGDD